MTTAARLLRRFAREIRPSDEPISPTVGPHELAPAVAPSIAVTPGGPDPDVVAEIEREMLERATDIGTIELRTAAIMVAQGDAKRVVLSGFGTWPGLLAEIERLSREHDVSILPTIARPGGRVDLVVSRPPSADG
jgi:hypothetical protein